jgi:hypothetical protein
VPTFGATTGFGGVTVSWVISAWALPAAGRAAAVLGLGLAGLAAGAVVNGAEAVGDGTGADGADGPATAGAARWEDAEASRAITTAEAEPIKTAATTTAGVRKRGLILHKIVVRRSPRVL